MAESLTLQTLCKETESVAADSGICLQICLYFIYLAIVAFVASYGEIGLWMWTGELICKTHTILTADNHMCSCVCAV